MAILALYPAADFLQIGISSQPELTYSIPFRSQKRWEELLAPEKLPSKVECLVTSAHLPFAQARGCYIYTGEFAPQLFGNRHLAGVKKLSEQCNIPAYIIDPFYPVEYDNRYAAVTGSPQIKRAHYCDSFILYFLAQTEEKKRGLPPGENNFIVAHLAEEIQIGLISQGKLQDFVTSRDEGPFGWTQAGGLPFDALLTLCEKVKNRDEILIKLEKESGLKAYLELAEFEEIFAFPKEKDNLVLQALAYQIGKEIGAFAAISGGSLDGILLGGSLVKHESFITNLSEYIHFLAKISLYPGNQIFPALFAGAQRITSGEEIMQLGKEKC